MKTYSHTPVIEARTPIGLPVWFKMDCYQTTGSFKIRGMDRLVAKSLENGRELFVASSGGNAGLSLAYAARLRGGKVTVVVPESTNVRMRDMIAFQGAEVVVHGHNWNAADELARKITAEQGAVYVSPFDDPLLWEGHSTLIDEVVADLAAAGREFPGRLVLACGGGGLLTGCMQGLERHGLLDKVEVCVAETLGAASYRAAVDAGELVTIDEITSIATTLGARRVAEEAWKWYGKTGSIKSYVCSDEEAVAACHRFAQDYGVVVEPSCGAALSMVYPAKWEEGETLVVVCGGAGWTLADLKG